MLSSALLYGGKGINGPMVNPRLHILFIAAIFLLSVLTMGSVHEWAEDEPYYMIAADHMEQGGSLLTPTYADGSPRFPKPIFFYWLVLLSYKVFGVSLFASRVPALVSAAIALYFTFRLTSERGVRPLEGFTAVYILASLYLFYFHGKVSITDMTMTAAMIAGFCLVSEFLQGKGSNGSFYTAAFAFGLAGLTKGPVALVLAVLTMVPLLLAGRKREYRIPSTGQILLAILIMSAVTGWWYVYMGIRFWPVFLEDQLGNEVVRRMDGFFWVRLKNTLWYIRRLTESGYPWTLVVIFIAAMRISPAKSRAPRLISWCGLATTLFFYGLLIDTKRTRYMVPALPFVAIILSDYLVAGFKSLKLESTVKRALKAMMVFAFAVFIILSVILLAAVRLDATVSLYVMVGIYIICCAGLMFLLQNPGLQAHPEALTAVVSVGMVLTFTFSTLIFQGTLKRSPMADLAKETYRLPAGSRLSYSALRRDLFSGTLYFFGNRAVMAARDDNRDITHKVVTEEEMESLEGTPVIVAASFNYSRGKNVSIPESMRNGDLLRRLPRDNYYLIRVP